MVDNFDEHCPLSDEDLIENNRQVEEYWRAHNNPLADEKKVGLTWYPMSLHFRYLFARVVRCQDGKFRLCAAYRFRFTYNGKWYQLLCYVDPTMTPVETPVFGRDFYRRLDKIERFKMRFNNGNVWMSLFYDEFEEKQTNDILSLVRRVKAKQ